MFFFGNLEYLNMETMNIEEKQTSFEGMEKEKIGWRVHTQYSTKNPKVLIMKKMYVKLECRACGLYNKNTRAYIRMWKFV